MIFTKFSIVISHSFKTLFETPSRIINEVANKKKNLAQNKILQVTGNWRTSKTIKKKVQLNPNRIILYIYMYLPIYCNIKRDQKKKGFLKIHTEKELF